MSRIYNLPDARPRLVTVNGEYLGIKTYDVDNGYPQRMLNLYNASGSAKMCANLYSRYIVGKGFENLDFYKKVIGKQGKAKLTPDKLLRMTSVDKARFDGFALHINWNAAYKIETIQYVPFEYCREGIGDNYGKIGVYKDWFNTKTFGKNRRSENVDFIHVYDADPIEIERQVESVGGWENYKGQIFYYSGEGEDYPLATIDPVLDDVDAEIQSAITRRNNLTNNFQLKQIWVEKGEKPDVKEEQETVDEIRKFIGPSGNAVSVVFSESDTGADIPQLISVQSNVDDKLFQYTDETTVQRIYRAFGQPAILHSDYKATSGYNEGQLPQSMAYYNAFTEPDRILFEEIFRELFSNFKEVINPADNYKITPLEPLTLSNGTTNQNNN